MFGIDDAILAATILGAATVGSTAYAASKNKQTGFAMNAESWKYYQKQRELDYQYDSGKYLDLDKAYNNWYKQLEYDWKQRYAQNSPKWSVEGLKNAGLNPILAASGGFTPSQMTSGSVTAQHRSSGSALGNSADMRGNWDIAGGLAGAISSARNLSLMSSEMKEAKAKAEVASKTVPSQVEAVKKQNALLEAQTTKAASDAAASLAQAEKAKRETADLADKEGSKGWAAEARLLARDIKDVGAQVLNQIKHNANDNIDPGLEIKLEDGRVFDENRMYNPKFKESQQENSKKILQNSKKFLDSWNNSHRWNSIR